MSLTFIHLTDTHLGEAPEKLVHFYGAGATLKAVLKHIAQNSGHGASFMVQTGDLIRDWSCPMAYETGKKIYGLEGQAPAPGPLRVSADGLDLPWYYLPGNVDDRSECLARLFPGSPPVKLFNYTWMVQGIRFLSLDWGAWKTDSYQLVPETYAWLEQQLQQKMATIILTHHPPVHVGVDMFDRMTPPDLSRLQELIAASSVLAIIHGHTHYPWEKWIGQVPVFGTGSVTYRRCLHHDYSKGLVLEIHPPQYRVVTIDDNGSVKAPIYEVALPA